MDCKALKAATSFFDFLKDIVETVVEAMMVMFMVYNLYNFYARFVCHEEFLFVDF